MRDSTKEKIIVSACRLFYENGFQATSMDNVVAEAGITKVTLYRYFPSKDELAGAVIHRRDDDWMQWFQESVEAATDNPDRRLLAMFDVLETWFLDEKFHGCAFLKAAAEFPDMAHPVRIAVTRHMERVESYIQKLVDETGMQNPMLVGKTLTLLLNGTIASAFAIGPGDVALHARQTAERILQF